MQRLNISGTLMRQDTPLCEFTIVNDVCTSFSRLCKDGQLFPYGCNPDTFDMYQRNLVIFFYDRTTPSTRIGIDEVCKNIGIGYYDMSKLIEFYHGASIQDPFWIRQATGPQTWDELDRFLMERAMYYMRLLGK